MQLKFHKFYKAFKNSTYGSKKKEEIFQIYGLYPKKIEILEYFEIFGRSLESLNMET